MPEAGPKRDRTASDADAGNGAGARSAADRKRDHASIARLSEELLPALIAKLGSTNLGELEVREGEWHIRLRRPFGVGPGEGRRATDRPSRTQPGHEGHGHGRAAPEGHRAGRSSGAAGSGGATGVTAGSGAASASTNGSSPEAASERSRTIATSPAVGIFQPGSRAASGTKVRAGDSLGTVDVLGVPQDILAPVDGIVGSTLVEAGTAVEYGQELIRIELTGTSPAAAAGAGEAR